MPAFCFLSALWLAAPAAADTIGNLPEDTVISGSEILPSEQGAQTSKISINAIADFINGGGIAKNLMAAPYNAVCDGVADDSQAFKDAAADGGAFWIAPNSTCVLTTVSNVVVDRDFFIYTFPGAGIATSVDISDGVNFLVRAPGRVGVYNLTVKNGGSLFTVDDSNTGEIADVACVGNYWTNVETWCLNWDDTSETTGAKIGRLRVNGNTASNITGKGLNGYGGRYDQVWVTENFQDGGTSGIRIGYVGPGEAATEILDRKDIEINTNVITNIEGNNFGADIGGCIVVHGYRVNLTDNICDTVSDSVDGTDFYCIYANIARGGIQSNICNAAGEDVAFQVGDWSATSNPWNQGCSQGGCSEQITFSFNQFYNMGKESNQTCVAIQASGVVAVGNQLDGCSRYGFHLTNETMQYHVQMKSNQVLRFEGSSVFFIEGAADNIVIETNHIGPYNNGAGVSDLNLVEFDIFAGQTSYSYVFRNNLFDVTDIDPGDQVDAFDMSVESTGILDELVIDGNLIKGLDRCMAVNNNGVMTDVMVLGNIFANCDTILNFTGTNMTQCLQANNLNGTGGSWGGGGGC